VRRRRQAHDQKLGTRVAEAWDRSRPVRLVAIRRALLGGYELAPGDKPRAAAALDNLGGHSVERVLDHAFLASRGTEYGLFGRTPRLTRWLRSNAERGTWNTVRRLG
jgi:hypothetical protein